MSYSSGTYHETYVFTGQFDDQISAPVDQASISMDKAGDSATNMASQIKGATEAISAGFDRANQSAGRADAGVASFNRLQRVLEPTAAAVRILQRNLDELDSRFSNQKIAPEQYYDVHAAGVAKLEAARAKMEALRNEAYQTAAALGKAAPEQQTAYSRYFASAQPSLVAAASAQQGQIQDIVNKYAGVQTPAIDNSARTADIKAYGEALDAVRAKYDPLFRVSKEYSDTLDDISAKQKSGALTAEQAAAAQERVTKAFADANPPLRNIDSALQASQQKFKALQGSLDPLGAALGRAKAQLAELNEQIALGGADQQKYTELLPAAVLQVGALAAQHDKFLTSINKVDPLSRNAAQGIRFMSTQWVDIVQQLAGGQNPIQVILQQGGQILQIAQMTGVGFKEIGRAIAGFAASATGLTTIVGVGLVGAVGSLGLYAESTNRRLGELRDQLSKSRSDYEELGTSVDRVAKQVAGSTSASFSQASQAAKTLASNVKFSGDQAALKELTTTAENLGHVLGVDIVEAAKLMSRAMADPAGVLKELSQGEVPLRSITAELRLQVEEMIREGNVVGAAQKALEAFRQSAAATPPHLTELQQALHHLDETWQQVTGSTKSFAQSIGEFIDEWAGNIIRGLDRVIAAVSKIGELLSHLPKLPQLPGAIPGAALDAPYDIPGGGALPGVPVQRTAPVDSSRIAQDVANQLRAQYPSLFTQTGTPLYGPLVPGQGRAIGTMQILPGTAAGLGGEQFVSASAGNNLSSGLTYLNQLYQQGKSGPEISNAYGGATSSSSQAARASALASANVGALPSDVAGGIGFVGQIFGWPDWLIDIAKRTAYVESRGQQFSGGSSSSITSAETAQYGVGRGAIGLSASPDRLGEASAQRQADADLNRRQLRGVDVASGLGLQADKVKELTRDLHDLEAARDAAKGDPKEVARLTIAIADQNEKIAAAVNPLKQQTEALQDQGRAAVEVGQANRALIQIYLEAARARQGGQGPTDAQVQARVAALTEAQTAAFKQQDDEININIDATNRQAAAWTDGAAAVALASAKATAHKQVLDTLASATHDTAKAEEERTQKILQQAASEERLKAGRELNQLGDQIAQIRLENDTLGQDNDTRALAIQHLKDEQAVRRDYAASIALGDTALAQSVLAQRDAVAQMESNLRARTRDFDEISGAIGGAFDNIGNSIAQAFIQGEGSAVNFLNVMKSVAASIIQEFIKLTAINPLRNILFGGEGGQTLPTITSVFNSLGQSAISSGQVGFFGQGIFGTSQQEARLNAYNAEFANPLGASSSDISAGNFGPGSGILPSNTPGATGLFGGASIGGTLGGALGGFGLGAGLGNITQSAFGKTGPGPMIGAAIGAGVGAIFGPVGALVGGAIGGVAGGLIGPKPPSPYAATFVSIGPNGELVANAGLSGNQITQSNLGAIQQQAAQFNKQQSALGVKIIGTGAPPPAGAAGGLGFFGTAKNPQGLAGENITDAFSNLRFGASSGTPPQSADILNRYINTKAFSAFDDLGKAVDKVRTFIEQTVPSLLKLAGGTSSLDEAIKNLDNQFSAAIQTAQELGYSETDLVAAREKAIQNAKDAVTAQLSDIQSGLDIRYAAASAALSGNPQEALAAQLQAFDIGADQFRRQTSKTWTDALGDGIKTSDGYIAQMASVERTLGQERLAIAKQANDAIKQQDEQAKAQREAQMEQARGTGAQLITSIRDYAHGLQYSQQSPLSPQQMFAQAQRDFNAVSGAAAAGDATSLAKVTSYSDTLLQSARALYGSGQGYSNVFKQVTDTLARIGEVNPDTLTASVFAIETRTQTTALTTALAELKAELAGIRAQLASGSAMPARLAA